MNLTLDALTKTTSVIVRRMVTASPIDSALDHALVQRWRRRWDDVMANYLPGLSALENVIGTVAETTCAGPPEAVLDLGGGPGVLAERLSARWPEADVRLLDLDPVLLALARAAAPAGVTVHHADLSHSGWPARAVPDRRVDLVTVIMTMHYLPEDRVRALYHDIRAVLRPGGLLVVADCMHDGDLPAVMNPLHPVADEAVAGVAWSQWWDEVGAEASLRAAMAERDELFTGRPPAEFTPDEQWHRAAARAAGYAEAGIIWRQGAHAALCAVA